MLPCSSLSAIGTGEASMTARSLGSLLASDASVSATVPPPPTDGEEPSTKLPCASEAGERVELRQVEGGGEVIGERVVGIVVGGRFGAERSAHRRVLEEAVHERAGDAAGDGALALTGARDRRRERAPAAALDAAAVDLVAGGVAAAGPV